MLAARAADIDLSQVSLRYGETMALAEVSFRAEAGEFVVLLGPSGCGKSSLLRVISGLETPHSGQVRIGGRDVSFADPATRGVAMVFQSYALFPHLNVAENIVFGLRARRVPAHERERRLLDAANLLGLSALLRRRPSQLSGGQQQRVALARAVVAQAPICLMDEPLSNLDAQLRAEMRREIRALQRRLGVTMIYVTHDQAEAMSMADRVVLLNAGRVEQAATPQEIYAEPANVFAARFIGAPPMSLLRLVPAPGGAVLAGTQGPVLAETEFAGGHAGIRAEHVELGREGGIPAEVASAEYLGADTIVVARLGQGAETVTARVAGHRAFAPSEATTISFDHRYLHLFHAAGRRKPGAAHAA
jgi:sn-glycerol 3-phosphate transport system ATP-binding protein